jgi:hypothetical protein
MRCRVGDLAVIVRSRFGNEGRIVRCVRLYPAYQGRTDASKYNAWGVVGRMNSPHYSAEDRVWCAARGIDAVVDDGYLRPLRPDEGTDEMLRIAGLPHKEIA